MCNNFPQNENTPTHISKSYSTISKPTPIEFQTFHTTENSHTNTTNPHRKNIQNRVLYRCVRPSPIFSLYGECRTKKINQFEFLILLFFLQWGGRRVGFQSLPLCRHPLDKSAVLHPLGALPDPRINAPIQYTRDGG